MLGQEIEHLNDRIMIEFSKTLEIFDLTPLEAQLFAHLFLKEEALTLDEMSVALGKSKTAISNSIRSLSDSNLVKRVWKKGVRKNLYEANTPLLKTFMSTYINQRLGTINHQKDALKQINRSLEDKQKKNVKGVEYDNIEKHLHKIICFIEQVELSFKRLEKEE